MADHDPNVPEIQPNLELRLAAMRQAYHDRLKAELERVQTLLEALRTGTADEAVSDTLRQTLHKLAGSAGTFGFPKLGVQARRLERTLASKRGVLATSPDLDNQPNGPGEAWIEHLLHALREDESGAESLALTGTGASNETDSVTIWLVERDSILADYIAQQLRSFGFHVELLQDAGELAERDCAEPDLLLLDHNADESLTGRRNPVIFWQNILAGFQCPIIFTGGEEGFDVRLKAVRSGGKGYFAKPLDVPQLATHVARVLNTGGRSPERVLIVEDDPEMGQFCVSTLENAGMQVRWLREPDALIETAIEFSPELVLMDLWLPHATGPELVAVLSQSDRWLHLPIVYLSVESCPEKRNEALLSGGDAFIQKPVDGKLLVSIARSRVRRHRELEEAITRDSLTGLLKHASIKRALSQELESANRHGKTISFLMLDIDHFKAVNDAHGHATGDLVISAVGTLLRQYFRTTDQLGRYGGEEFAVVLTDCSAQSAAQLAEGLRRAFSAIQFIGKEKRFSCTLSVGVADNRLTAGISAEGLSAEADQALYRAKRSGRDRVCISGNR